MVDKLIYIINVSVLMASIFCVMTFRDNTKINKKLCIFIIFILNVVNRDNMNIGLVILSISSYLYILNIKGYRISECIKNKIRLVKIISFILLIIMLKDYIYLSRYINLILNIYITYMIFKINIYFTSKRYKNIDNELRDVKLNAINRNRFLKEIELEKEYLEYVLKSKKEILEIIQEQSKKCVMLIDEEGYISNESSNFINIWNEYECCNYKIKFSKFLNKNIVNSTETLLDVQKVYALGVDMNKEIMSKDNRYFDCKYTPFKVNGKIRGVLCVMTDITYKKCSEKIIDCNNRKYKKTIETIPHTIVVIKDKQVIYNNNKNIDIDIYDEKLKNFIVETEETGEFEGVLNNSKKYLNISKTKFEESGVQKEIAIIRDVTEDKILSNNIDISRKKYLSLVNSIPQGIYIYDFELKDNVYVNDEILKMTGYENLSEFNESQIINEISWALNKYGSDVKFVRHRIKNKNGKNIDVELGGITLEINNKIRCIGIMNDITDKVRAEKLEKEIISKKLEYKQKNHFFINISHELKTPLNLIMASNQLVESIYRKNINENPNSEIAITNNTIKNQSYISLRLVENIITLTKLESDFYKQELDYYDIVSIVEDVIYEINNYSKNDKLEIIFDTNVEEKIVEVDPYDIERVILLVLSKVIKKSKSGSIVNVEFLNIKDKISILIKNNQKYDKSINLSNQCIENINMNIEVAKSIMKLYDGDINILEKDNSIEVSICANIKNSPNYELKKLSKLNKESIYAEYSMINAL